MSEPLFLLSLVFWIGAVAFLMVYVQARVSRVLGGRGRRRDGKR